MSADGLKALPWLALYALAYLVQPAADALPVSGASNQPSLQDEADTSRGS